MQQLIKKAGFREAMIAEAPPGIFAFVIASYFFKFGSFAWECLAFLATWYALSLAYGRVKTLTQGTCDTE